MIEPDDLELRARAASEGAAEAVGWIDANRELLGDEAKVLGREYRRYTVQTQKIRDAVSRPMCVGVFGPSQAGKSYLISALARKDGASLMSDFGGTEIDFVKEINPEGGTESTGIVTRFTIAKHPTPQGYPVHLRLLTQMDVVKILANTYFLDVEHSEREPLEPKQIQERIEEVRARARNAPVDNLREEEIYDLQEYCEKAFKSSTGYENIRRLRGAYWAALESLVPCLEVEERARIFGLLWGDVAEFTQIYIRLYKALQALGFPADAFCALGQSEGGRPVGEPGALIPRQNSGQPYSIIDVATLTGIGRDSGDKMTLVSASGASASVPRSEVAALTAELRLTMKEKPWDFFEHTDLLDFPGARSRVPVSDVENYLKQGDDQLRLLFIRGKVAYLFDRYTQEKELNSMLLCIAGGNQEVQTLPDLVNDWIESTQGRSMQEREQQENVLFLVLTKFDMELQKEEQKGEEGSRWSIRLHASLKGFFGNKHRWPFEWRYGKPFNNTFWTRNPNFPQRDNFEHEDDVEIAVREDQLPRLQALREGFIANADVKDHFSDPPAAWDAAMHVNDGGITYLAQHLQPVCDPQIKLRQLEGRLNAITQDMRERLVPYYVDDDLEKQREKKKLIRDELTQWLGGLIQESRFYDLLDEFVITDDDLREVYWSVDRSESAPSVDIQEEEDEPQERSKPAVDLGMFYDDDESDETDAAPAVTEPPPKADKKPAYSPESLILAGAFMEAWVDSLHATASDDDLRNYYASANNEILQLSQELMAASRRLPKVNGAEPSGTTTLRDEVTAAVQQALRFHDMSGARVELIVRLAAAVINRYVQCLGYDREPEDQRPEVGRPKHRIFRQREEVKDFPQLDEDQPPYEREYALDWIGAMRARVLQNALDKDSGVVDIAQNTRLGKILAQFGQLS